MTAIAPLDQDRLDPRFGALDRLFFVIGAQKAGTTWVQHHLAAHPQVCVPVFKELNYWAVIRGGRKGSRVLETRLDELDSRPIWAKAWASLFPTERDTSLRLVQRMLAGEQPGHSGYADALFQRHRGQRIAGEINPQYALMDPVVYGEMSSLARDVRFVFLMRDPLSRLFSGLKHALRNRVGDDGVTEQGLRDQWEKVLSRPGIEPMRRSQYDLTIRALDAAVPADKVAYFFFESLFSQVEVDRLTRFIGADPRPADVDQVRHEGAGKKLSMPADLVERTMQVLAPTYEFMHARFGDQIPASWRRPQQGALAPQTKEA